MQDASNSFIYRHLWLIFVEYWAETPQLYLYIWRGAAFSLGVTKCWITQTSQTFLLLRNTF